MNHFLRSLARAALFAALVALPLAGCGGADDSLGLIGGQKVDASAIDRDPMALLPSGIILLGYVDAAAMFQSKWGPDAAKIVSNLLPLGAESNFSAPRDVTRVYGGVYAMQGADFCAIVQGNFDVDAIHRAADARAITISGASLVKTRYADNDLYTAGNVGFAVVTAHTVLSGNETGMRRALDRLRSGKLERSVPPWMVDLAATPGAQAAIAGDLGSPDAIDVTSAKLPYLGSVKTVRVIGNFQPPGMNFAGTLSYADAAGAQAAAQTLQHAQQLAQVVSMFTAIGFGAALPSPELAQHDADLAFTLKVDENLLHVLLGRAADLTRGAVSVSKAPPGH